MAHNIYAGATSHKSLWQAGEPASHAVKKPQPVLH